MVLTLFEQLEKRENEVLSKERRLEDKESKLNMKLEELKNDVQSIESLIKVKCDELQNRGNLLILKNVFLRVLRNWIC